MRRPAWLRDFICTRDDNEDEEEEQSYRKLTST
ncbi:hypothetical protein T01_12025 [Trichinella spiralis]|uniref:Uncharacterized protein n=1 Tax=Trichinella spiralis TaxID=6334 RepID=A0A0V1B926_TRISP|nr:hypothetical protein T01_12025 [Trichinella spiralis]